jgi:hypothetical protein
MLVSRLVRVQLIAGGPHQHSRSSFRGLLRPMTKCLFLLRPFICLEMGPPTRGGVGLSEQAPHLLHRNSSRVYQHSHSIQIRAFVLCTRYKLTSFVTLLQ